MKQCEHKKPKRGQYVKEHTHGEGIFDSIKSVGRTICRKTAKRADSKAVSKVSEHVGEKLGDKIIKPLHNKKQDKTVETPLMPTMQTIEEDKPLSCYEINERVNQSLIAGKLRKMKFM